VPEAADGLELAAQELAAHETDDVDLNFKTLKRLDISNLKGDMMTPREGPFSAERNQEIFKVSGRLRRGGWVTLAVS
jgi:hypothetical protein